MFRLFQIVAASTADAIIVVQWWCWWSLSDNKKNYTKNNNVAQIITAMCRHQTEMLLVWVIFTSFLAV